MKNKNNIILIVVAALVFGALAWFTLSNRNADVGDADIMMNGAGEDTIGTGSYEAYAPEKLALAEENDVLLFFHADWCPICRGIESEINAGASKIPDGVYILKIDHDSATALRQKYGVTVQHTFVQVDAAGNALQKFSDAYALSDVLSRVK